MSLKNASVSESFAAMSDSFAEVSDSFEEVSESFAEVSESFEKCQCSIIQRPDSLQNCQYSFTTCQNPNQ